VRGGRQPVCIPGAQRREAPLHLPPYEAPVHAGIVRGRDGSAHRREPRRDRVVLSQHRAGVRTLPAPDSPERLRGIEALKDYWAKWEDAFDDFGADVEEHID